MIHSLHVSVVEGRQTSEHLEQQRAQRPPINSLTVTLVFKNLWSKVLRGTTEGLGATLGTRTSDSTLRQTEISQSNVSSLIQPADNQIKLQHHSHRNLQNVLGLQITIHNVHCVQSLQRHSDLCSVQPCTRLRKLPILLQPKKQFSSCHVV